MKIVKFEERRRTVFQGVFSWNINTEYKRIATNFNEYPDNTKSYPKQVWQTNNTQNCQIENFEKKQQNQINSLYGYNSNTNLV